MGMRAVIVHITKESTRLTSTFWSTFPDVTLGHYLDVEQKNGHSFSETASSVFSKITTEYNHISSFGLLRDEDIEPSRRINPVEDLGGNVFIQGYPNESPENVVTGDLINFIRSECELDQFALGMIYDESNPDYVQFISDSYTPVEVSLAELAKRYHDALTRNDIERMDIL